jgi:hypothetical protein
MNTNKVREVINDLESWRAVEKNFYSRKLIDDAVKKLRVAMSGPSNEQEALALIRAGSMWLDASRERPTPAEVAALDGT